MSRLGIGIDFGTTNSAAAVFDGRQVCLIQLESVDSVMPSATYIDAQIQTKTGQAAIDQYICDNTGRTVEMIPEVVAEISQFVEHGDGAQINEVETSTQKIYGAPVTDAGLQGRLFRGTKRLLGDERVRRLMVFDQPFRLVALITPLLLRIQQKLNSHTGLAVDYAHIGHPVNFEGRGKHRNPLALDRLSEAYKHAGVTQQEFYAEPIAAATSYLHSHAQSEGELLLTVDFGGGTLDLCVLRKRASGFDVVATHGIGLGGDHIDQLMFKHWLFPLLGEGEIWVRKGFDRERIETRFPFEDFADLLLNWAVTYTLNQNYYRAKLAECIGAGGAAAEKFERLDDLITHNHSYLVFQAIKDAKAALSNVEETILDVPELDISIPFNRSLFEKMMTGMLAEMDLLLDQVLARANCDASDIDVVIRTGGSSQIAAVRRLLESRFTDKVTEHDPFTSVAAGLAIASYHGYEFAP